MLIHDPITRERFWNESGGICGLYGHSIPLENAFLEKNDSYTKVVGWLAGITLLPEIIQEVSKNEFKDVFSVLRIEEKSVPRLEVSVHLDGGKEVDAGFFNRHRRAWLPLLTWTCWWAAGDESQPVEERAHWWGILNKLCNEVFVNQVEKNQNKAEVRFVLPAGLMRHPCRVNREGQSAAAWHQLNHLAPAFFKETDYCSPRAIEKVRAFLAEDRTAFLFNQDHKFAIQAMPLDPTTRPFMGNADGDGWSVVSAIRKCINEQADQVAVDDLTEGVFENLDKTFRAHLVELEEARVRALEITLAACAVATGKPVSMERVNTLLEVLHVRTLDPDRASIWVMPLKEAAGL